MTWRVLIAEWKVVVITYIKCIPIVISDNWYNSSDSREIDSVGGGGGGELGDCSVLKSGGWNYNVPIHTQPIVSTSVATSSKISEGIRHVYQNIKFEIWAAEPVIFFSQLTSST